MLSISQKSHNAVDIISDQLYLYWWTLCCKQVVNEPDRAYSPKPEEKNVSEESRSPQQNQAKIKWHIPVPRCVLLTNTSGNLSSELSIPTKDSKSALFTAYFIVCVFRNCTISYG